MMLTQNRSQNIRQCAPVLAILAKMRNVSAELNIRVKN